MNPGSRPPRLARKRNWKRIVLLGFFLIGLASATPALIDLFGPIYRSWTGAGDEHAPEGREGLEPSAVERAYAKRISNLLLETTGTVQRVLPDDREGIPHQRFVLELPSGHTVLVAHNLDLAPRVPLERGDRLTVYGEYEWNDRGGVIHWTHDDPRGRRAGGWVRHRGTYYR